MNHFAATAAAGFGNHTDQILMTGISPNEQVQHPIISPMLPEIPPQQLDSKTVSSPVTIAEARAATHIHQMAMHFQGTSLPNLSPQSSVAAAVQQQPQYFVKQLQPWHQLQPQQQYHSEPAPLHHRQYSIPPDEPERQHHQQQQQQQFPNQVERRRKKMHRRSRSFGQLYASASSVHHTRENSAGLDILSAAADGMNQEELAAVAAPLGGDHLRDTSIASATSSQVAEHSRDLSLTAFGSLGSWDLKRLMNSISPPPPPVAASDYNNHNNNNSNGHTSSYPMLYQQEQQQRSNSPPTPMISNIDRNGAAATPVAGLMHPLLPNLVTNMEPPNMRQTYHDIPAYHPYSSLNGCSGSYPDTDTNGPSEPLQQHQQKYATLEPRKLPHHQPTFSAFLNTLAAPASNHHFSREQQQPHHSREPSEPAKLLMQLERSIEQQNSIQQKSMTTIHPQNSIQQQSVNIIHPQNTVYGMEPPHHGEVVAKRVVGQMVFPSTIVLPTPKEDVGQPIVIPPIHHHQMVYSSSPNFPLHCSMTTSSASSSTSKNPPKKKRKALPSKMPVQQQPPVCVKLPASPAPEVAVDPSSMSVTSSDTPAGENCGGRRVRRKCSVPDCDNRVVQGGLCISHGAKRKQCSHPGCEKNVKKAGLCSSHGPARKKCEDDGCNKVAVQGGRCITHGAKKKLCVQNGCDKQGIINGYCKKHHDLVTTGTTETAASNLRRTQPTTSANHNPIPMPSFTQNHNDAQMSTLPFNAATTTAHPPSTPENTSSRAVPPSTAGGHHTRGLSIFHDLQAMEQFIVSEEAITTTEAPAVCNSLPRTNSVTFNTFEHGRTSTTDLVDTSSSPHQLHKRGLSLFGDENVSDAIISGVLISGGP
eukprot:CAMPEP_0172429586 /NCGR_PEP_ID=MMETSP1064-20121228/51087_1 /TAXON_ID=202472 /ORGANISM="Aulacoseira subarctica , Strain CCAP 1002/5" /LENGTH=868 /DNA_ID=CAMNT_0013175109 /DNA_START=159 /DNA_END=2765 /DNA_ORIENTATION=+